MQRRSAAVIASFLYTCLCIVNKDAVFRRNSLAFFTIVEMLRLIMPVDFTHSLFNLPADSFANFTISLVFHNVPLLGRLIVLASVSAVIQLLLNIVDYCWWLFSSQSCLTCAQTYILISHKASDICGSDMQHQKTNCATVPSEAFCAFHINHRGNQGSKFNFLT